MKLLPVVVLLPVMAIAQAATLQVGPGAQTSAGQARVSGDAISIHGVPIPPMATGCLHYTGTVLEWLNPCGGGGGSGFTPGGDLSGTATSQQVIGIRGSTVPAPTTAGFLEWTGSTWTYGAGGTFTPTSPFTIANGTNSLTLTVPTSGNPVISSTSGGIDIASLFVTNLAGTGVSCLQTDALGNVTRTGAACGTGGGGTTSLPLSSITDPTAPTTINLGTTNPVTFNVGGATSGTPGITIQQTAAATSFGELFRILSFPGSNATLFSASNPAATAGVAVDGINEDLHLIGTSHLIMQGLTNAASLATNASGQVIAGTPPAGVPVCTPVPPQTSPNIVLTCVPATSGAYQAGESFTFVPPFAGSPANLTLNVDGRGASLIYAFAGRPDSASLAINVPVRAVYNGTNFNIGCMITTNPGTVSTAPTNTALIMGWTNNSCPGGSAWALGAANFGPVNSTLALAPNGYRIGTLSTAGVAAAAIAPIILAPTDITSGSSTATGGSLLLRGSDNAATGGTGIIQASGAIEVRPGILNAVTGTAASPASGTAVYEVGGMKLPTGTQTQGMAACVIDAVSWGVGNYSPRYSVCTAAPSIAWVGTFSKDPATTGEGTLISWGGDAVFYSSAAVTWLVGQFICLDTVNAGAFVASATACPAGEQAGIVKINDGAVNLHNGVIARR